MYCVSRQERRQLERDIDKLTPGQARIVTAMVKEQVEMKLNQRILELKAKTDVAMDMAMRENRISIERSKTVRERAEQIFNELGEKENVKG